MKAVQLCARHFAETHPDDAARLVEQSVSAEAAEFLAELPPNITASILSQMSLTAGAESLSLLDQERAAAVVTELGVVSAASLLRRLDAARRTELVAALPEERREQLKLLLEYPDGTVGAAADPEVLAIPSDLTSEAAQRLLRRRTGMFHHQLYVVDRAGRLRGYVHVRDLVRAAPKEPVSGVMRPATTQLQASAKMASTVSHPAWRDMDAIPVVDKSGILLGILRHRQLRRLAARPADSSLTGTLLGFSELYWLGLSMFLPFVQGTSRQDQIDTRLNRGGTSAS
ncbi:MAG: CBS domain-containing protein [Gemmatimonadales bacterium]|jgi:magnesium transporter